MGKKSRRETQKSEEAKQALATTKAAAAKEAKRALVAKPEEPKGTLAKAKDAVAKADQVAEAVEEQIVEPVVVAVKQPKKVRFVREKTAKNPVAKDASLPPRSTTAAGKMMSKNLAILPKEEMASSQKPKV